MRVEIHPSSARGTVTAPPSKSMAHRLLICAGLCEGESVIRDLAYSDDVKATVDCLRALGADIRLDGSTAYVKGADVRRQTGETATLPCNECGSTLRFFTPLCMLSGERHILTGSEYLMRRPMSVYEDIAAEQDIVFDKTGYSLTVCGKLGGGIYKVRGDISSQFISGLMFALPLTDGDSEIHILPPVESRPYINLTVDALRRFGIEIIENGNIYSINGGQSYSAADVTVEGDYSNAAFFESLNLVGSDVSVNGLNPDSKQGDKIYKILFKKIKSGDSLIDISDCPDLGPILFAVAAACGGARFTGTRRLRIKESDRADAMRRELSKLGASVEVGENEVAVRCAGLRKPSEPLYGHNDHRIVMALSVLLTATGGVIEGAEAVNKSFPDFFDRLKDLGVELEYGMDQSV